MRFPDLRRRTPRILLQYLSPFTADTSRGRLPQINEHKEHRHGVGFIYHRQKKWKPLLFRILILLILIADIFLLRFLFRWSVDDAPSSAESVDIIDSNAIDKAIHSTTPLIPRRIYITYKYDLCDSKMPSHVQQQLALEDPQFLSLKLNVERIRAFHPEFEVECFDDDKAYRSMLSVAPKFAAYFKAERKGMYKADLFRIVMLYHFGGYYFDADMEPIESLSPLLRDDTTFTSSVCAGGDALFQSYLGSTRFNDVLKLNLDIFEDHYGGNKPLPYNMGTRFLSEALQRFTAESDLRLIQKQRKYGNQNIQLFQEQPFDGENAADIIQQRRRNAPKSMKDIVQFAVYDPESKKYVFFGRLASYERDW